MSKIMHHFDPEIAVSVGINAAIIYQNIVWWCATNEANEKNYHDGRYWTYNSIKAFEKLFPYLTRKQIRTALATLENVGLILAGTYNSAGYDRTKWYCPVGQTDLPLRANGIAPEGQPIPVNKPVNKPDILREFDFEDFVERFLDAFPKQGDKKTIENELREIVKNGADPDQIINAATCYAQEQAGNNPRYIKRPENWLKGGRWKEAKKTARIATQDEVLSHLAEAIKNRIQFRCNHITASKARELIARGLVDEAQCKAAGVSF